MLGYGMFFVLVSAGAMIALAVFLGIQNSKQSVQQSIVDDCNAALTNSPFTDVSVTELRGECVQDNAYYLQRTVMWTGIRAGMQVPFFLPPTILLMFSIPSIHKAPMNFSSNCF